MHYAVLGRVISHNPPKKRYTFIIQNILTWVHDVISLCYWTLISCDVSLPTASSAEMGKFNIKESQTPVKKGEKKTKTMTKMCL